MSTLKHWKAPATAAFLTLVIMFGGHWIGVPDFFIGYISGIFFMTCAFNDLKNYSNEL